jgi:AGCS family alanine or glycine:cation symporter
MAETKDAIEQGMLAMLSTYAAGFIALLSGLVALLTRTWESTDLTLGMCMVASSFQMYFSSYGIVILGASVLLFGFGTILGNSYNGTQCFSFLTGNKGVKYYFLATAGVVLLGAISDVKLFWSCTDVLLAAMAVPHMSALVYYTFVKKSDAAAELITI